MRWIMSGFVGVLMVAVVAGLWTAAVTGATPTAGHNHGGHSAAEPTAASSPYADRYDPAASIRSLTPQEIQQIERGEGAGFALPAELNGLPGPRHVLDLADALNLSPEQRAQVQQVFDEMQAEVIPAGERYLDALTALEEDLRGGLVDEEALPSRVGEIYRLEGEVAAGHIRAHLRTAELLTADQIATYQQLRGYEPNVTASGTPAA